MNKRRKRHNPEQIVRKLRDADAILNAGKVWLRCCGTWRSVSLLINAGGINMAA